jgi:hypothetical protein
MAANSGRPSSVFLVFMADTTLTISIFSILFPQALALSLYLMEPFRAASSLTVQPVQEPLRELLAQRERLPFPQYSSFKTHVLFVSLENDKNRLSASSPMVTVFASPNQQPRDVIANYVEALKPGTGLRVRSLDAASRQPKSILVRYSAGYTDRLFLLCNWRLT